jgi:hypothetical protein
MALFKIKKQLLILILLVGIVPGAIWIGTRNVSSQAPQRATDCLPFGTSASDVVIRSRTEAGTLGDALQALQAKCTRDGFVTSSNQRIQVFRIGGCFNMSEADKERLRSARADLMFQTGLNQRYEPIVLDCYPHWGH